MLEGLECQAKKFELSLLHIGELLSVALVDVALSELCFYKIYFSSLCRSE